VPQLDLSKENQKNISDAEKFNQKLKNGYAN
jgi:hypothetical protein